MEPEKKTSGALVGLIVIIVVLILGVVYVIWQSNQNSIERMENTQEEEANQDANALDALETDAGMIDTNTDVDVDAVY